MSRHTNLLPQFQLQDIYGARQLRDVVITARERVFSAFDHATEVGLDGQVRGAFDRIASAGVRQSDLVRYVLRHRMQPFVSLTTLPSLPPQLIALEKYVYRELIAELHRRLVELAINGLVDERIIWHDGCAWNVLPDKLTEYRARQQEVTKAIKEERRREHSEQKG